LSGFQSPLDPLEAMPGDGAASNTDKTASPLKRLLLEALLVMAIAIPLALALHTFVTQVYSISGHSMEPTLEDGQRVVVDKVRPAFGEIDRGDLIIFVSPEDSAKNLIKRVIGIGGDRIELIGDKVRLNGKDLVEDYTHRTLFPDRPGDVIVVKPGHLFMLGDNRPQSRDSRDFGTIPVNLVRGKVLLRLWPIDDFKLF